MPTTKIKNIMYRSLLPVCAPSCGSSPLLRTDGHPIVSSDAFIKLIRKHHVLGSATLISNGKDVSVLYTKSDSPSHIPEPDTFYRVASITKMATAVLALKLAEKGLLRLEDTVSAYLPSPIPDELKNVTLYHLLSHRSGLMDPVTLETDLTKGRTLYEVVRGQSVQQPGSAFRYSNLGFGILGCVFESVMNKPVDQIFETELFQPMGMDATLAGCSLPPEKIMPVTRVLPYRRGQDLILTPLGRIPLHGPDPTRHFGHTAGSMYTTVHSLHILLRVLTDPVCSYLSQDSLSEMKSRHASYGPISPDLSYGLGLLRIDDPQLSPSTIFGHQGFAYGCADGAFWDDQSGHLFLFLNGGCSEARKGRLGLANREIMIWAFREELSQWS